MAKKQILVACLSVVFIAVIAFGVLKVTGFQWDMVINKEDGADAPTESQEHNVILDLSMAYETILDKSTNEFIKGYPIDNAFLHWVGNTYGEDVITDIAYSLYEGNVDSNLWYEMTGSSMHVLWLTYCKTNGYSTYYSGAN